MPELRSAHDWRRRHRRAVVARALAAVVLAVLALSASPGKVAAKVFYARDEMLKLAFPDADKVEPKDFLLTREQREAIESFAREKVESDLLTIYVGRRGEQLLGYAIVDTHIVRTLPETFLVVLSPEGAVAATHVLAFYEPLEYLPSERWFRQFPGRKLTSHLRVGDEIAGISGSTLSSRAVTAGVRRALAAYTVLIEQCDSSSPASGPATGSSK
jgi:hypothetical protein